MFEIVNPITHIPSAKGVFGELSHSGSNIFQSSLHPASPFPDKDKGVSKKVWHALFRSFRIVRMVGADTVADGCISEYAAEPGYRQRQPQRAVMTHTAINALMCCPVFLNIRQTKQTHHPVSLSTLTRVLLFCFQA